jgi:nucleotidyltransferase substrate binding protein (TIGR01987 family)
MHPQARWQERFSNFKKSFALLQEISSIDSPSEAEELGFIKSFEMCFELAWKTLKDYLNYQGQIINSPRDVIKQASQDLLINNVDLWLEALLSRNETNDVYVKGVADRVSTAIKEEYLELLKQFCSNFLKFEEII